MNLIKTFVNKKNQVGYIRASIASLDFVNLLKRVDLPIFGLPTIATIYSILLLPIYL